MKDTMAHLPADYTFGIKYTPDEYSVGHLIGSGKKITRQKYIPTKAAGIPTRHGHSEDDVRPHVRKIQEGEDTSLGFKITEDVPGGELNKKMLKGFQLNHVFGVPTVKGPRAYPVAKRLADTAVRSFSLVRRSIVEF